MHFNNNGYHGSFFVSTLCFSPEASKASCVLNNDGAAAAAAAVCLPQTPCFACEIRNDSRPFPSNPFPLLIKALPPLDSPLIGSKR